MTGAGGPSFPSAATRLFGVLGHPVAHSLSPVFQNAAFRALGLDACYLAFDVAPDGLADALRGLRAVGAGGLNVTLPHKERALALAAEVDEGAVLAGAANTLAPCPTGWRAFNTDVEGFLRAVEEELGFRPEGRRALVLGAGGAARAAASGLLRRGIQEIRVANRNGGRAEKLAATLAAVAGGNRLTVVGFGELDVAGLAAGDLVVSATPAGLHAEARWPFPLEGLAPGVLIYDMAYGPGETPLVTAARASGLRAASGRRMLLHQGAAAFSLWTGAPAPLSAMEDALRPKSGPAEGEHPAGRSGLSVP